MKKLGRIVAIAMGGLIGLVVLVFGVQWVASESGEVVVLYTLDDDGGEAATRLWVVDHAGHQYLRVGADGSGWYRRLLVEPKVGLERDGERRAYRAELQPELSAKINALMQEKYGWRDSLMAALVGGREGSVPIRLTPGTADGPRGT